MKRSLLITLDFPPLRGGVAAYYQQVCRQLPKTDIVVLTTEQPGAADFDISQSYPILRRSWLNRLQQPSLIPGWKSLTLFSLIKSLDEIIKKYNIGIIQVGNVLPLGTLASLYQRRRQTPYIVYAHGLDILLPQTAWRKKIVLKKVLTQAHGIVANSHFTADQISSLGVSAEKIKVVWPGANLTPRPVAAEELNRWRQDYQLENKKVLLTVGRLIDRKGIDTVIETLPELLPRWPNLVYCVIGQGPAESKLRRLISQKNLTGRVWLIKNVNNQALPAWYQLCDIFVLPARQIGPDVEGFGLVYLEANLFGKPVIGSRLCGVS